METVKNTASHDVDLPDGRMLAPGETAEAAPGNLHIKTLVDSGALTVVQGKQEGKGGSR